MNFGEALGYWYLRLNGFIPMTNFVQHRFRGGAGQNADCDILGVRFPHTYEMIGGEPEDWDNKRMEEWDLDLKNNTIGVISEIKTSAAYTYQNVNGAFDYDRLKYSIYRLGFFEKDHVDAIARDLIDKPSITDGTFTVAKLFVFPENAPPDEAEIVPCLHLTLEECDEFIKDRMHTYAEHKRASRMFFSGDLIQYFAWKGGCELKTRDE